MSDERNETWSEWSAAWRAGPEAPGGIDVAALRARLHRERRRTAAVVAGEALVAILALAWAVQLMRADAPREAMTGVVVAVFTAIVVALSVWARRGAMDGVGDSVVATLSAALRRCETRARVFVATYAAAATALGFLVALARLRTLGASDGGETRVAIALCALGVLVGITAWRDRRNREELARLLAAYEALHETAAERP